MTDAIAAAPGVRHTPVHLWIIGTLAVLWNAMGAFDYVATQFRLEFYISQFTEAQLDYFYSWPAWMHAAWAVGVWGALLGSLALLLRKPAAVWLFGLSLLGLLVTSIYSFVLSDGAQVMGSAALIFSAVIWVVAICLFLYASAMYKRGVLQ